ncbi:MAG: 5-(carboxyamino)imidazole ribonucleotide mutase [Gammaproteobacteria bacterium]|nr:5-(carboxyamino)imidazole ribonucleotide mutase [Gammaproteobacteria bacterium]
MNSPFVAILMGSDSDLPTLQGTVDVLKLFGVRFEIKISSAHRTPQATHDYVLDAQQRGCAVFICAAGLAAHLAGAVAALTVRPVIGVPMEAGPLSGLDALLSTVQMPGGVPVATVAIGSAGAKNAAYLAVQILALADNALAAALVKDRADSARKIATKDAALQQQFTP